MVLAIVALFASTQVLAKQSKIIPPRVTPRVFPDVVLKFINTDGKKYEARIKRDVLDPQYWKVKLLVEGKEITVELQPKNLENLLICERDDDKGTVRFGKNNYFCHVLKAVSEGALLLGNHVCIVEIAPGIYINI
jgi:hypothetical protein